MYCCKYTRDFRLLQGHVCITYKIKRAQMLGGFGAASDLLLEQLYDSSGVRRSEQRSELLQITDPVLMLF